MCLGSGFRCAPPILAGVLHIHSIAAHTPLGTRGSPFLEVEYSPPILKRFLSHGTLCLVCVAHEDSAGDGFLLPTLPERTLRLQAHVEQIWTTYFAVTNCITSMLLVLRDLRHLTNRCPQWRGHG